MRAKVGAICSMGPYCLHHRLPNYQKKADDKLGSGGGWEISRHNMAQNVYQINKQ